MRAPTGASTFTSALGKQQGGLSFLATAGHNLIPCLVFAVAAALLAFPDYERVRLVPRLLGRSLLAAVPNLVGWWVLAGQASSVAAATAQGSAALMLRLPHGSLEFGALELPLIAAWLPRNLAREERQHHVARAVGIAVLLIVVAALVETFVSPALFNALTQA